MADWWEDAPLADEGTQAPAQQATPEGNWWESSPIADPATKVPADQLTPLKESRLGILGGFEGARASADLDDPFVQAERLGVEAEGTPQDLRKAYLQMSPGMRDTFSQELVNRYFKKKSGGNSDFVPVQYNEAIGTHLFKDPDDGKWKPLNDLGIDLEDTREVMKYIVAPVGASLGAGIGTAAVTGGSPFLGGLAATGTDAAVSGAMRAMDINSLLEQELLPEEYVSAGFEGAKESGWALLGSALGGAGGRVIRKGFGGVDDIPMNVDVSRKDLNSMLERFNQEYGDTMPNLTLDEKMSLVAKTPKEKAMALRVRARKENLQVSAEANAKMIERRMENQAAFETGLDQFLKVVGKQDDPGVFRSSGLSADELLNSSTRIIDTLNRESKAKLQQYDAVLADAYTKAQQTADDVLADAADPYRMPTSVVSVFDAARTNFDTNTRAAYDAIGEATGGQRVFDVAPVRAEIASLRKQLSEDEDFQRLVFNAATKGTAPRHPISIAGQQADDGLGDDELMGVFFGEQFRADRSGLLVPDSVRRQAEQTTTVGYKEIDSALKNLRERTREMSGKVSDRSMRQVYRLQSVLAQARDDGLKKIDPELASSQQALDATYRIGMDALDRGIGKKLANQFLEPRPGVDGLLLQSTFNKMFKGDAGQETVRDIRTLMDMDVVNADPSNPIDMLGVVDNVRRGLLGELKDWRMVPEAGRGGQARVLTPESFQEFRKEYRDALELALRPGELAKIEDMTGLRKALQKAEADNKAVREKIAELPWADPELANSPAELIRKTWAPIGPKGQGLDELKRSRQLRQALREQGDPDGLISDYRKLIAHDMMTNVTDKQTGMVDPYALKNYLDTHQEQLAEWYTTRRDGKSGMDLVTNLEAYSRIGQTIRESAGLSHADKDAMMAALNSVARAYVGVFTTAGRVLTAVKQLGGGASLTKEADFVLNPGKYIKNQEFYEILNSPQMRALNRAGGHGMINSLRDRGEERPTDEPLPGEATPLFERRM